MLDLKTLSPIALTAVLIVAAACARDETKAAGKADQPVAARPPEAVPAAQASPARTPAPPSSGSMLKSSTPATGATVTAPENLELTFIHPMRLAEVTVTGSDGQTVPIMITAAGAQGSFSVPLPDLAPGAYDVRWRALGDDHEDSGVIRFTVR